MLLQKFPTVPNSEVPALPKLIVNRRWTLPIT
jgi:hypothetical protein